MVPAGGALGQAEQPTIVYLHGNGGHIGYRGGRVRPYLDAGFGVLLVEYRGYGGNPGRPSEPGLQLDAGAALAFLDAAGVAPQRTVVYGESLGAAVAVALAADRAAAGPSGRCRRAGSAAVVDRRRRGLPLPVDAGALAAR